MAWQYAPWPMATFLCLKFVHSIYHSLPLFDIDMDFKETRRVHYVCQNYNSIDFQVVVSIRMQVAFGFATFVFAFASSGQALKTVFRLEII